MMQLALQHISEGKHLSFEQSQKVFMAMLQGELVADDIADLLQALARKGETAEEIAGAATVMREKALTIQPNVSRLIDVCGTGGDGLKSFNISTTVAFVLAGGGVSVAKHGNRSVSSRSGSADVLEHLGISLDISPEQVTDAIEQVGIGFLFAPAFHPGMKHVMPVRKKLGIRTIFNILGPLVNPANAPYQVIGVFRKDLCETMAHALQQIGLRQALIVHGVDGMDEITLTGKTFFAHFKNNEVTTGTIDPRDYGFSYCKPQKLVGGDPAENAAITLRILKSEEQGAKRDIVLLNAAAGFWITGKAQDIGEGIELARESIDSGKALEKLEVLRYFLH